MTPKSIHDLGSLQRAVIEVLWELGEGTVSDVRARLGGRRKPAYTTVLSVMQKLERAGWVRHRAEGRAYVYRPARSRREEGVQTLRRFVGSVFRGDAVLLFEHLLESGELSAAEIATLRRMIDEHRRGGGA